MPNTGNVTATPVKLVDAVDANQPPLGTASNPVRVDPTGTTVQPVSVVSGGGGGTQYADGAASGAHPTGTQVIGWNKGATTELGVTARALTNAQSLDVSIVDGSGNQVTSFGGSGGTVNQGTAGTLAGAWPVELSDGTNLLGVSAHPVRTDPTGTTTQPVSGTVTTTPPSHASTNVDQWNGTTVDTNSGVKSAGTLRVVLATDQPALTNAQPVTLPAGQAVELLDSGGTNKASISAGGAVKVDNSAVNQPVTQVTSPWVTSAIPAASGGLTISHLVSAATTNATSAKGSPGQVYGWSIVNTTANMEFVKLHNTASTPTPGSGVVYTIGVPGNGGTNLDIDSGLAFSAGIGFTTTTGGADADTGAVGAGDLIINLHYK